MNSRQIIADAWHFTGENKKLMWWYAFIPSLLTTLIGILYLAYQFFAFKKSKIFDNAEHGFLSDVISTIVNFFKNNGELIVPSIVVVGIILLFYFLLPTLYEGGMIQLIAKKRKGEHVRMMSGLSYGLLTFLPLLEYNLLIKSFSLFSLLAEAAFIWRNLGTEPFQALLPIFIVAAIVFLILTLLFTYSEFFLVLDRTPVLRSMGRSAKLVIVSWQHTFLIGILMLIISLRVFINIIAVLLVPLLLFVSAGVLATIALPATIGYLIAIIISFVGLFVASYFNGIISVFATAVWTFTFMELMHEKETKELMAE